ncbi:MAG: Transcriptional regulatory protein ZraR [Syntrophaceae bacterium PtaU1.Bin231]|nr:MAG: Transcriptional regulatory protein ZraR [Syntrophaceae bacterium PtaU1.Bin231]
MKIADIFIKVSPLLVSDGIDKAGSVFQAEDLDLIPVVDHGNNLVGVLRHHEILDVMDRGIRPPPRIESYLSRQISRFSVDEELEAVSMEALPAVVIDHGGKVAGIITADRFAEVCRLRLRETVEKLNAIMNSIPIGIIAVDERGYISFINSPAAAKLGKAQDQIVGHYVKEIVPETRLLTILKTGKRLTGQKFAINGRDYMVNYAPVLSNGKIIGAVSAFQDFFHIEKISEELKTVKALNSEMTAIFNSSDDSIWITDGQGKVLNVNMALERLTGLKAADLIGKTMEELIESGLFDHSAALQVIKTRERVTINQTVKGKVKFLSTGSPIFDGEGNLVRVVVNVRSVAKLVKLQNKLLKEREQALKFKNELTYLRAMNLAESDLVFRSTSMRQIVELTSRIAGVDSTVLITGESGTGKDVLAKLIHRQDKGDQKPFITINCAAIPEQLLESELFGYEGGAFTGARKQGKTGMFEVAHTGTLFLDEVAELPLGLQVKLLRAIQDRKIFRVGGTKPISINVRIITATNKDLMKMLKNKTFREDLYYRLMVIPIHIPPLRERKEDIPPLVFHFLDQLNNHFGFEKSILPQVIDAFLDYPWPGNVRELRNVMERMVVISQGQEITTNDLPDTIRAGKFLPETGTKLKDAVMKTEIHLLSETYKKCGSWQKVAEILGVNFTTVYRKVSRYGLLNRD